MKRLTGYDLGIIGGMGSEASAELYKRIVEKTFHSRDQEHMKICVLNNSIIPNRTDYILNNGKSPVPYLNEAINDLEKLNTKYFVLACNTAHKFINGLKYDNIKLINMIDEAIIKVKSKYHKKVCVLATNGTIKSGVYHQNENAKGIEFIYLSDENQEKIMKTINDTKNGLEKEKILNDIIDVMKSVKKDCVYILACTELSLYKNKFEKNFLVVDAMDCLVESAIKKCGYVLKGALYEVE